MSFIIIEWVSQCILEASNIILYAQMYLIWVKPIFMKFTTVQHVATLVLPIVHALQSPMGILSILFRADECDCPDLSSWYPVSAILLSG